MSSIKECRIGLLGAARITPPAIILPAQDNPAAKLVAIAARDNERARRFAAEQWPLPPGTTKGPGALLRSTM